MFHELNHLGFIKNIINIENITNRTRFPAKRRDPRLAKAGTKSWLVDPIIFGASVTSPFLGQASSVGPSFSCRRRQGLKTRAAAETTLSRLGGRVFVEERA
jgi:hypothetical protein